MSIYYIQELSKRFFNPSFMNNEDNFRCLACSVLWSIYKYQTKPIITTVSNRHSISMWRPTSVSCWTHQFRSDHWRATSSVEILTTWREVAFPAPLWLDEFNIGRWFKAQIMKGNISSRHKLVLEIDCNLYEKKVSNGIRQVRTVSNWKSLFCGLDLRSNANILWI